MSGVKRVESVKLDFEILLCKPGHMTNLSLYTVAKKCRQLCRNQKLSKLLMQKGKKFPRK